MDPLDYLDHRPWSLPGGRWIMTQTWHNLLFAHWPLPPDAIRPLVPPEIEIDTFDAKAWLGIIPFRLSAVRLRGWPEIPIVARFPEINVRTYVTQGGKPGVFFLSLDSDNILGIALARPWFRLAYHYSRIRFQASGDRISFRSERPTRHAKPCAAFSATYGPCPEAPFAPQPDTLEHWLTERYCYYAVDHAHNLYRCEIHHAPWQLQRAQAHIEQNTMALSHGIELPPTQPLLYYSHYMKALIWRVNPI